MFRIMNEADIYVQINIGGLEFIHTYTYQKCTCSDRACFRPCL